jgi:hypothetical protein
MPYLNNKHVVFFHDVHCFYDEAKNEIMKLFGRPWEIIKGCEHPGNGYNLAVINNL